MKSKKTLGLICVILTLFLSGCGPQSKAEHRTDVVMGTLMQQTLYIQGENDNITREIFELSDALEKDFLSKRVEGSEVFLINSRSDSAFQVSDRMKEMINNCMQVSEASEGAFDIFHGRLVQLWDIDSAAAKEVQDYKPPVKTAIDEALKTGGYQNVQMQENALSLQEFCLLDPGAVGKGIALDEIAAYLRDKPEITGASVSVGGSVLVYGIKPDKSPWCIGITDPFNKKGQLGFLEIKEECYIATSGDYERFAMGNGKVYHHILDPATGYPADNGVKSVTIVSREGWLSDALSTACFVLGTEKGLVLAEEFGSEALFVTADGQILMTEGMKSLFRQTKP